MFNLQKINGEFIKEKESPIIEFSTAIDTGVPLATEPGISLIILTTMKILQRNRHTLQTHSSSFLTQRTYSCSNFVAIGVRIIKEMPSSVASGTLYISVLRQIRC